VAAILNFPTKKCTEKNWNSILVLLGEKW